MSQGKALTEQERNTFVRIYTDPANSYTVKQAAKLAGISERSAYYLLAEMNLLEAGEQADPVPDSPRGGVKNPKNAGRKSCPELDAAFEEHAVPMLEKRPKTMAVTIIRILREKLGKDADWAEQKERSIQRRVRTWKQANARKPKAFLPQHYDPGYEMQVDFTHMDGMGVTIKGKPFKHMLFGAYLRYSGMRYFEVVPGGETFDALYQGTVNAFRHIGGVPVRVHTDSLSAASKNMHWQTERNHTRMAEAFRDHYGIDWHLSNPGRPNEKGGIERANGNLKQHFADWLADRGSSDFESEAEYRLFVRDFLEFFNSRVDPELRRAETDALKKLPETRFEPFAEFVRIGNAYSFVRYQYGYYSIPNECIGKQIGVLDYGHRIELLQDGNIIASHEPAKLGRDGRRYSVEPIHVIGALNEKYMGLKHLAYLEQLFLNELHARTFDLAIAKLGDRKGCRLYVSLLSLAVEHGRAAEIDAVMTKCLATGELPDISQVREQLQIPAGRHCKAATVATETDAGSPETAMPLVDDTAEPDETRSEPNRVDFSGEHPLFSYADALADGKMRRCFLIGLYFMETARSLDLSGQEGMQELANAAAVMLRNLVPTPASETPPVEAPACEPPTSRTTRGPDAGTGQEPLAAEQKPPVADRKTPSEPRAGQNDTETGHYYPTGREVVEACGNLRKQGANYYVGPCPVCGGKDCFSVDVSRNIIYCRKCEPNGGLGKRAYAKLMQVLDFSTKGKNSGAKKKKAETASADENGSGAEDQKRIGNAVNFWKMRKSVEGTRTEEGLRLRGITWRSDDIGHTDRALRADKPGHHQCMVVRFVNTLTNQTQAVQRTFWDEEDSEKRRKNMGVMSGAAAFIGGEWECAKWTVAEGTEDAASLAQCGVDGAVLATGGTETMKKLKVPDHVTCVVIAADNDEPGNKAASVLKERLEGKGLKVEVRQPADGCKDWNEMLCKGLEDEIRRIMRS